MLPFSSCSNIRITAWWKYCCPCVKLSPLATSKHPRSGAPMTCAQGFSLASAGFCSRSSSRFGPEASSAAAASSVEEPGPDSRDTRRARKSRQSPSSAGATSSSAEDNREFSPELSEASSSPLASVFGGSFFSSDASLFFVSGAVADASSADASADAASLSSELFPSEPSVASLASDTSALSSSSERLARVATEETVGASRMTWPTRICRRSRARAADARRWRLTAGAGGATARAAAKDSITASVSEVRYKARPAVSFGCGTRDGPRVNKGASGAALWSHGVKSCVLDGNIQISKAPGERVFFFFVSGSSIIFMS